MFQICGVIFFKKFTDNFEICLLVNCVYLGKNNHREKFSEKYDN